MTLLLKIQDDDAVITLGRIAAGDRGTAQTVGALWAVVQAAAKDPLVRRAAHAIGSPDRLYDWCRAHVRFKPDPIGVEVIRTPQKLLRQIGRGGATGTARGDCDDLAALGCSLLAAMGARPVVSTVGAIPTALGGRFQHIFFGYAAPHVPGGVVLMDPQEGFTPGGLPRFPKARLWWADGEHAA